MYIYFGDDYIVSHKYLLVILIELLVTFTPTLLIFICLWSGSFIFHRKNGNLNNNPEVEHT